MSKEISLKSVYSKIKDHSERARTYWGRALTFAEKILLGHAAVDIEQCSTWVRQKTEVEFRPDRVAMQDATAQMALLQFMHAGMDDAAVPTTVHCDHLIQARVGAKADLLRSIQENDEVFEFLASTCQRYGIGFWEPGAGIIHQVVLENYAFPGGMMIGTDSHTPNAGGLGMIAIGVGGADAVDVMVGEPFGLRWPGLIGVQLTGALQGWASPKDVILRLMGILTVKGGTGHIVEFFGPGCSTISATGKATICNMGAEHGATTSIFPYDKQTEAYLAATGREDVARMARDYSDCLAADAEVLAAPQRFYDRVIHIDLSTLEPYWVGPHSPDVARPVSAMRTAVVKEGFPEKLSYALIGSCTNSSYEDISRAADVARQARALGIRCRVPLRVTPGSAQIQQTIERDGHMAALAEIGAEVLANACGPCIGQWHREDIRPGEKNAIVTSYNRNFRGRNDANTETMAFIGSPEVVTAVALSGRLDFNPQKDTLMSDDGQILKLRAPVGEALPAQGFVHSREGFVAPSAEGKRKTVNISAKSDRLQLLERFAPYSAKGWDDLLVLLKARGKCTTDHISAAGSWLRFRGHLANISNNLFLGATNAFTGETGKGTNILTGEGAVSFPELAKCYRAQGIGWVVFGDENYGEGSSREHAAMSPRFLGGKAIIARSFARIHETNLKKQGMLALTFVDAGDYDKVQAGDRVSILGLDDLCPGKCLEICLRHIDGSEERIMVGHTYTETQIGWFRAGSALNQIASHQGSVPFA